MSKSNGSDRPRARTAHQRLQRSEKKKRQQKFLRRLREFGTVYEACRRSHIGTQTVYRWAKIDGDFRRRMLEAKDQAIQRLETSAYRRAMKGDTLLTIFMLKGMRPEVYRDRYEGRIDESELNAAIERELDRVASASPPAIPGVVEGQVRDESVQSPPAAERLPEPGV